MRLTRRQQRRAQGGRGNRLLRLQMMTLALGDHQ